MKSNVIDLNVYRNARRVSARRIAPGVAVYSGPGGDMKRRLTRAEQDFRTATRSHCTDAVTGGEVAGVPTVQLIQNAPTGEVFWCRCYEGHLYYVAEADLEWQRRKGWDLTQVRLVTPGVRHG